MQINNLSTANLLIIDLLLALGILGGSGVVDLVPKQQYLLMRFLLCPVQRVNSRDVPEDEVHICLSVDGFDAPMDLNTTQRIMTSSSSGCTG